MERGRWGGQNIPPLKEVHGLEEEQQLTLTARIEEKASE